MSGPRLTTGARFNQSNVRHFPHGKLGVTVIAAQRYIRTRPLNVSSLEYLATRGLLADEAVTLHIPNSLRCFSSAMVSTRHRKLMTTPV